MNVTEKYTRIGGGIHLPDMLIIHAMAEYIRLEKKLTLKNGDVIEPGIYAAHDWLQLLGLSCHFLLHPDGSFTKQRSTKQICWHAKGYNTGSIGIEILVQGTYNYPEFLDAMKTDYLTKEQFGPLVEMSNGIIEYFDMKKVVRHCDISPERKNDPGAGFDWELYKSKLI